MTIQPNEQPTFLHGSVTESAVNTFTVTEISVPRVLTDRMLFDIDEVVIESINIPKPTLGADAQSFSNVQLQIKDTTPTALMDEDDPQLLAYQASIGIANATDIVFVGDIAGRRLWETQTHANLVPDDKVWLCIEGTSNRAGATMQGQVRIKGKLAKVGVADFEALVLSRLSS